MTFSEGASGALTCTATGVPAPTISWFWDGVLLNDDGVTFVLTSSTDASMPLLSVTSTLNVTSVMRESAFATITCTASNGVGANSSDTTQLIVLCESVSESVKRCQSVNEGGMNEIGSDGPIPSISHKLPLHTVPVFVHTSDHLHVYSIICTSRNRQQ